MLRAIFLHSVKTSRLKHATNGLSFGGCPDRSHRRVATGTHHIAYPEVSHSRRFDIVGCETNERRPRYLLWDGAVYQMAKATDVM